MLLSVALALVVTGCEGEPVSPLILDGPARITVDKLGHVDGPVAVAGGTEAAEIVWSASPEAVAHVMSNEVHAVGPGEALVTGTWREQSVSWTLVVQPAVTLRLVSPPGAVTVGQSVALSLEGRSGSQKVDPGPITWATSDEAILTVSDGTVTGVAPGLAYITAAGRRTEAMLELHVEE